MLKLFRNIRRKIIDTGTVSRYLIYAIGEIILVVVGILIALQINNWNENKNNRLEEHQLLRSLKEDLETSLEQLDRKINGTRNIQVLDSTTLILIKESNTNIDSDSLMLLLTGYVAPPTFDPESGTIEEIKNSGKSNIISNPEIRRFISSWSSNLDEVKEIERTFNLFFYNRKKPYLFKYIPYRNNNKQSFGRSNYKMDDKAIFSSIEYENMVHESWVNSGFLESRYLSMRGKIMETLQILETELIKK